MGLRDSQKTPYFRIITVICNPGTAHWITDYGITGSVRVGKLPLGLRLTAVIRRGLNVCQLTVVVEEPAGCRSYM